MTAEPEPDLVRQYVDHYAEHVAAVPRAQLERMASIIWNACLADGTVYVFGNGACAALAAHMATDLAKGTTVEVSLDTERFLQPRIRIVSLSDNTALLTAYGNDVGYDHVFVEQLRCLLREGDVVIGLSGSGGSPNVLRAMEYAEAVGAHRFGLTGRQDSAVKLVSLCDVAIQAPSTVMEHIEDWHVIYNHILTLLLRTRMRDHVDSAIGGG
jgi:D-sedoheptulose 7-phosphate isomerase